LDHNLDLLFGVLALQADLLTNDQFAEACSAWVTRKHMPLADLLVERGWLTAADKGVVQQLVERKLKKHGGDVRASLAEAAGPKVQQSLAGVVDPDLQASLRTLGPGLGSELAATPSGTPAIDQASPSTTAYQPARRERYTLTRLHAKGGIGQVWLARDEDLGREVALKELQPEQAANPALVARFVEEARIAAQLQHPGIIPVYELSSGLPAAKAFYTMKFIRGQTLADACKRYHQRRAAGQAGPLELRELLGAFVTVCQAVAYAHARNVIHRDLKTSNVALGDYGEVLVLDFGLSKVIADDPAGPDQVEEPPSLAPVSLPEDTSRQGTLQGQVLGTPSYMAPEQAQGRLDRVDQRSDIYSLGAILYEILTGKPPYDGGDKLEILKQVVLDPIVRPRQRVAAVPAALEAICLKALAKKQAERYASAVDLAAEVQRFLADESVDAFPEPWTLKARRWLGRHRTLAATAAAALVVATVGLAIGAALLAAAGERERLARADAEQQRDDANRAFYVISVGLAQRAWEENNVARARELLEEAPREAAGRDLRGFEWHYLSRLCHSEALTLEGHVSGVAGVAFSPDGSRLASAGQDSIVKVWESATGKELLTLRGHLGTVSSVAFSPDGSRLASAGGAFNQPGEVKIWDCATGQELHSLRGHANVVTSVVFSPDGLRLASASWDKTVKIWDSATGNEQFSLRGHADRVLSVAFSPDGLRLASGGTDAAVKIWDVDPKRAGNLPPPIRSLTSSAGEIRSVAFSPDGQRLAVASGNQVKIWDSATGKEAVTLKSHAFFVGSAVFSPIGQRLAAGNTDNTVNIWDLATGKELFSLKGHAGFVHGVAFSPDGQRLASASADNTLKIWECATPKEYLALPRSDGSFYSVAFSPDGQRLASAGGHLNQPGEAKIWDCAMGRELSSLKGHTKLVTSVAFSLDGRRLASGSHDNTVRIWDIGPSGMVGENPLILSHKSHADQADFHVTSVAFSPDGKRLASTGGEMNKPGEVRIWDSATGQELLSLKGHTAHISGVAFSPDGLRLASCGGGINKPGEVKIWDSTTGQELFSLQGHTQTVLCVAFSPDGRHLATGSLDKTVKIWDSATGQELSTLKSNANRIGYYVGSVAFSPDGQRLVSGNADGAVKIWDCATTKELFVLKGDYTIRSVAFSPDGQRLASASWDRSISVWETSISAELQDQRAANQLVADIFRQLGLRADVLERLRTLPGMSPTRRQAALAAAKTYAEEPYSLNERAWQLVKLPGREMSGYRQALRYSEAACQESRNAVYLNTLGVAHYRVGNFDKALEVLLRSDQIQHSQNQGSLPEDLAFLAMTQHKLGHEREAQAYLQKLRARLMDPSWQQNDEARGFLRETEALLESAKSPAGK
jgi:WD40 repeat protein